MKTAGPGDGQADANVDADVRRVRALATWTDARFVDPLLGLILPGVGDVLGAAVGLYVVVVAARHQLPRAVIARMLGNLALDCVVGVIPVVGDLFDVFNRANLRNARLLEHHLQRPASDVGGRRRSGGLVLAAAGVLALALVASIGLAYTIATRGHT